jgi:hypothetical protein
MALGKSLILRKLRSSCLEGRTALILPVVNFLTPSFAGKTEEDPALNHLNASKALAAGYWLAATGREL